MGIEDKMLYATKMSNHDGYQPSTAMHTLRCKTFYR